MTPMTEIENLKDGVYEKVMSRRFAEVLKEALAEDQVCAEEEDVDAEEAVGYLSSYLQQVIRLCLKDIADRMRRTASTTSWHSRMNSLRTERLRHSARRAGTEMGTRKHRQPPSEK